MAFIEASLEELPVSANLGQSCLATKISAPEPSSFGWFRHNDNISEKFLANDKILESLAMQLEGFNSVIKHQLSFNQLIKLK